MEALTFRKYKLELKKYNKQEIIFMVSHSAFFVILALDLLTLL